MDVEVITGHGALVLSVLNVSALLGQWLWLLWRLKTEQARARSAAHLVPLLRGGGELVQEYEGGGSLTVRVGEGLPVVCWIHARPAPTQSMLEGVDNGQGSCPGDGRGGSARRSTARVAGVAGRIIVGAGGQQTQE